MSEAFEVSPDDPVGVAAAIERAAKGSRVRVVRQGRAVADIVPVAPLALADPAAGDRDARHNQIVRDYAARFGAPTLQHYRRVYLTAGCEWPGEDHIRAHYPRCANAREVSSRCNRQSMIHEADHATALPQNRLTHVLRGHGSDVWLSRRPISSCTSTKPGLKDLEASL